MMDGWLRGGQIVQQVLLSVFRSASQARGEKAFPRKAEQERVRNSNKR